LWGMGNASEARHASMGNNGIIWCTRTTNLWWSSFLHRVHLFFHLFHYFQPQKKHLYVILTYLYKLVCQHFTRDLHRVRQVDSIQAFNQDLYFFIFATYIWNLFNKGESIILCLITF
jgi:hypothetical protein